MRILAATIIAALAALVFFSTFARAQAFPGVRSPELEAKLPTHAEVYCTTNTNLSFVHVGTPEIYLDAFVCGKLLTEKPSLDGHGGQSWAFAAHTLYHEWWHLAFSEYNEKQTECGAYAVYRYALRHFWSFSAAKAQSYYNQTLTYSYYAPLPCFSNASDPLLLTKGI